MKAKKIVWVDTPDDAMIRIGFIDEIRAFEINEYYNETWRVNHFAQNMLLPYVRRKAGITFDTCEEAEIYCRTLGVKAILDLFLDETEGNDER